MYYNYNYSYPYPMDISENNVELYFFQTLSSLIGQIIVVQTVSGSLTGVLKSVQPDHLVLEITIRGEKIPYSVRLLEVVWARPTKV